ncbi:hypothetical protein TVAG_016380 [Trichomonas vaginalis G3]|uniref:Uncharacterized protein n=1 Tax=Trichomonas vaginalis (strain ATCC PRA-98 / G3) TaxID=412133 RepID=A2DPA8_TRIV3|nr:hypothetical protein TVAGG3_0910170 [Trichomonas vaginalis G3]EAY17808.1 hypothetical protein TVAG_016380 [Trichomonas vaginalis G3]KAI5484367.1 hypothetical protein TVAGG3_0910170 [Trichomonas vaginalis G3]|eukprot:XP_001329943.1 hypothetical protein [Trichomonas vaginalis G3]
MQTGESQESSSPGILPETMKHRMLILVNERNDKPEQFKPNSELNIGNELKEKAEEVLQSVGTGAEPEQEENKELTQNQTEVKQNVDEVKEKVEALLTNNEQKPEASDKTQEEQIVENNEQIKPTENVNDKLENLVIGSETTNTEPKPEEKSELAQNTAESVEQAKEKLENVIMPTNDQPEQKSDEEKISNKVPIENLQENKNESQDNQPDNENKPETLNTNDSENLGKDQLQNLLQPLQNEETENKNNEEEAQKEDKPENSEDQNNNQNEGKNEEKNEDIFKVMQMEETIIHEDNQNEDTKISEKFNEGAHEIVNLVSPDEAQQQPPSNEITEISENENKSDDKNCSTDSPPHGSRQGTATSENNDNSLFIAQIDKPYVANQTQPAAKKYSDEELAAAMHTYIVHKTLPHPEQRSELYVYIGHKGFESMMNGNYQKAKEMNILQSEFQKSMKENATAEAYKKREAELEKHLDNAIHQLHNLTASWEEKIQNYQDTEQAKLDKLGDKHSEKLDKFNEKYENPDNLREFSKASPALLSMRERERSLLLANEFKEATAARSIAEKMEEEEAERMQKIAEMEVNLRRQNLTSKLQKEINIASQKATAKIKVMTAQKEREEQALKAHIENLSRELEQIRERKGLNSKIIVSKMQPIVPKMSQQQVKQLKSFRNESPAKRLLVRPNVYTATAKNARKSANRVLPAFPE